MTTKKSKEDLATPDLFDASLDLPADATPAGISFDGEALTLADFAERAYLDYAVSVVKGRALPDLCDGMKPVQRRILYACWANITPTAISPPTTRWFVSPRAFRCGIP